MKNSVVFRDLGLIDYKEAWDLQESLFAETIALKIERRNRLAAGEAEDTLPQTVNRLLFCEHPHVYTLGKSGSQENLLLDEQGLADYQCPVWDLYGIMGELGSSKTWFLNGLMQSDMVHFTPQGYHFKANLFEDAWEKWLTQMDNRNHN